MNEPGINSIEELLLLYVFVGFIVGSLWGILEADVVLTSASEVPLRRDRARRIARVLAPLGIVHIGFALLAADIAKPDPDEELTASGEHRQRRARTEAGAFLVLGLVVAGLFAAGVA